MAMLGARLTSAGNLLASAQSGRSSGVEHNLAKVGVEGSNPFARSSAFPYVPDTWVTDLFDADLLTGEHGAEV